MSRGKVVLRLYWDQECVKPVDQAYSENGQPIPVDLGEVSFDGGEKKTIQLYLKNEGDRTYHIGDVRISKRPDLKVNFDPQENRIRPTETIVLHVEWDTAKAQDDLKFEFALEGKFYVFGD